MERCGVTVARDTGRGRVVKMTWDNMDTDAAAMMNDVGVSLLEEMEDEEDEEEIEETELVTPQVPASVENLPPGVSTKVQFLVFSQNTMYIPGEK